MSDWLDAMFEEKQRKEEAKRTAEQMEAHRTNKLQALLPSFWKAILTALDGDLKNYNERVSSRDKLDYKPVGPNRFVVEKNSVPPSRLMVSINSKGERVTVKCELTLPSEVEFKIRLTDTGDAYLEAPSGEPLHESEISKAMLKDFFRSIQGI